eukprot:TRINITY_DN6026_c0_g2_i2.p1 TRINITY_DN6026_c0_g2~~TRINITY_DN6026_c0_g2_i2.p1  ORF type:complete len:320 (+),score=58.14 TRINITY_DN6026_c0_g2_i2:105-962(+)
MCRTLKHRDNIGNEGDRIGYLQESAFSSRIYQNMHNELDFWMELSGKSGVRKELSMVVTPVRSCQKWQDKRMMRCPQSMDCIHRDLFCDGKINCANYAFDEDTNECTDFVQEGFFQSPIGVPIIIVLAIVLPIGIVIFIISCISIGRRYIELCYTSNNTEQENTGPFLSLLGSHLRGTIRRGGRTRPSTHSDDRTRSRHRSDSDGDLVEDGERDRHHDVIGSGGGAFSLQQLLEGGGGDSALGGRGGEGQDPSSPPTAPPPYSDIYKDEPPKYSDIVKDQENDIS